MQEEFHTPSTEETFEPPQAQEFRAAFIKRYAEAMAERREILLHNGLPDDTQEINPDEALKQCCS
jgi:hypothetical protein